MLAHNLLHLRPDTLPIFSSHSFAYHLLGLLHCLLIDQMGLNKDLNVNHNSTIQEVTMVLVSMFVILDIMRLSRMGCSFLFCPPLSLFGLLPFLQELSVFHDRQCLIIEQ